MSNRIPAPDDWRRQGQEKYMKGIKLFWIDYFPYRSGWDHDHCEFCGNKFSLLSGDLKKGYSTQDGYYWVCEPCYNDFKDEFNWEIVNQ